MTFNEFAAARYSCRKISARPVEQEKIDAILNAARLAPTAKNNQPVKIWVAKSPEAVDKVNQTTLCGYGAKLFFIIGSLPSDAFVRPFDARNYADVDAAIVSTHMMLAIQDQGLASTWVGNFDPNKMRELFPEMADYDLTCIFPVGYAEESAGPSPRHTQRKSLEELVKEL